MELAYKNNSLGGILNYYSLSNKLNLFLEGNKVLFYTIVWIKEGSALIEVDFERIEVAQGHILFLTPNQYVSLLEENSICIYVVCFNREFYCIEMHDEEVSCNGLLFKGILNIPLIELEKTQVARIQSIFDSLEEEAEVKDRIQEDMLKLLLKQLIIFCTRLARHQLNTTFELVEDEADTIRHFSALVEKNFKQKHKVADYAGMLNKSPKTLSNLFKKYNSQSPSEMIKERIILEAKRAFIYTELSTKEIAYDLGFDDPAHFSRYFSNATTLSPTKFKEVYFKKA